MRGVFRVLLTLLLAASCTGYFLAEKKVTLADDGRVKTVKTFAPTVGAALVRLGVEVGPDDRILPSPKSPLADSPRIEVRRARDVVVVLNGSRSVERVTGRTVAEVLKELSVASSGAFVDPAPKDRIGSGDEIVVAQPVESTVVHDGISQSVVTNVLTAGALLRQLGIVLGPHDRVEPSIISYPSPGSTIKVIRVAESVERTTSKIPFKRVTEKTDQLDLGVRKIKTPGAEGVRARSYRIIYEDGRVKKRIFIGTEVVTEPRDEVTLLGTRRPVLKAATNLQSGKASWYSYPGLTAAHRTLPMGTVVRVTNLGNGKQVTVTIRDRGPYIDGRIIDLSQSAFSEIAPTSSGVINVKIEW